jgi:glycosyltransferase involved in cell wall biosynthesis
MSVPAAAAEPAPIEPLELTVLMPCLNEARTLEVCIKKARDSIARMGIAGEVLIADNGSTDGSQEIARRAGARVVDIAEKGYGNALLGGIAAARSRFVIMGDADDSYDFTTLEPFVAELRKGQQLVMGNRFAGGIAPGAMPPLHRYFGNPFLSGVGRLFFRAPVKDFQCGLRGFERAAIQSLDLRTTGMEFASEMVVKATLAKLRMAEVPTTLQPDGRDRRPHLRSFRDGWRYLRFLLMFSPRWLFLYPGLALTFAGLLVMMLLARGPLAVGRVTFDAHTLLFAAFAAVLGVQLVGFAVVSRMYGVTVGLLPANPRLERLLERISLEHGLVVGVLLIVLGFGGSVWALLRWGEASFGPLAPYETMRLAITSVASMAIGASFVFTSFLIGILRLPHR